MVERLGDQDPQVGARGGRRPAQGACGLAVLRAGVGEGLLGAVEAASGSVDASGVASACVRSRVCSAKARSRSPRASVVAAPSAGGVPVAPATSTPATATARAERARRATASGSWFSLGGVWRGVGKGAEPHCSRCATTRRSPWWRPPPSGGGGEGRGSASPHDVGTVRGDAGRAPVGGTTVTRRSRLWHGHLGDDLVVAGTRRVHGLEDPTVPSHARRAAPSSTRTTRSTGRMPSSRPWSRAAAPARSRHHPSGRAPRRGAVDDQHRLASGSVVTDPVDHDGPAGRPSARREAHTPVGTRHTGE